MQRKIKNMLTKWEKFGGKKFDVKNFMGNLK